jgi:hypothetical protein
MNGAITALQARRVLHRAAADAEPLGSPEFWHQRAMEYMAALLAVQMYLYGDGATVEGALAVLMGAP